MITPDDAIETSKVKNTFLACLVRNFQALELPHAWLLGEVAETLLCDFRAGSDVVTIDAWKRQKVSPLVFGTSTAAFK
jgi:hypothetical protein